MKENEKIILHRTMYMVIILMIVAAFFDRHHSSHLGGMGVGDGEVVRGDETPTLSS